MDPQPRSIGPLGAVAIVAGTMLGVGILLTPPLVAAATGSAWAFYGLWIAGAVTALSGAVAYAELGAAWPRAGGDVVFQREAFGPSLAFASGSVTFGLAFAGSIAAMAVAVGQYQAQTLIDASGLPLFLGPHGPQVIGCALILLLTLVNALGARVATALQVACTFVPLVALAALALWGLATAGPPPPAATPEPVSLFAAFSAVYFTYAGWPAVVYLAGEVREPGRTLPLGMLGGTVLVTALYLLLCAAFRGVLGPDGLAQAGEAGSALAGALLGRPGALAVTALVLLALLASINGTILGGGRVGQGMAEQGALPRALAAVSARTGAPTRSLWLQAALAVLLAATGSFETILSLTSLAMMVVGSLTVLALGVLRRTQPDHPRPYRATGYPWAPLIYLLASGATVVGTVATAPAEALLPGIGVALLAVLAVAHRALRGGS